MYGICYVYVMNLYGICHVYVMNKYGICHVYTKRFLVVYVMDMHAIAWYIPSISETGINIHGIYMVYTMYIKAICRPDTYVWYIPTII